MDWGVKNRLSHIFKRETERTVMLAADHGYFLGPVKRLENPRKTLTPLFPFADALMVTRGILRTCINPQTSPPIVLRVSGGSSLKGKNLANEEIITSIEEAVRLNASAVALSIYIGTDYEHQTLLNLSKLVNNAQRFGIPVLAVTAVGKELEKREAKFLSLACRIAAEMGASFVKTYYCKEFGKVVEGCPIPIVLAGGPKFRSELGLYKMIYEAIQKGASGVDMGRNIWQSPHPVAMIKAVRAIVHKRNSPEEALEILKKE